MHLPRSSLLGIASLLVACSGGGSGSPGSPAEGPADGTGDSIAPGQDGGSLAEAGGDAAQPGNDGAPLLDAGPPPPDASKGDAGPLCKKNLAVICTVGTDCGPISSHSNGCWTSIDADGAIPGSKWRKCSSNTFTVGNASAPNWALDDTSLSHPAGADPTFLNQCASGASGYGFEYMAFRGGWELLGHAGLKAYFAELHSSDNDVDDYYRTSAWQGNAQLAAHSNVYPMINIAPIGVDPSSAASTILADGYELCTKVADGGYFAIYAGDWRNGYGNGDARAVAMGTALDLCTQGGTAGPNGSCNLGGQNFPENTCTETYQCQSGSWVPRADDSSSCTNGGAPNGGCVTDEGPTVSQNTCTAALQCNSGTWVPRSSDPMSCSSMI